MEDLEIVALADPSYHGRKNVIDVMKEIDKDRQDKLTCLVIESV